MPIARATVSWSSGSARRRQGGQALLFGIFILLSGLAVLFFSFNTGQLTREKTKLVNTADAAVYSAGVMHARTLNFHAYTNRAMVANTVAVAQLTSLASWVRYIDRLRQNGSTTFSSPKYAYYLYSYQFAGTFAQTAMPQLIDNAALEDLSQAADAIIDSLEAAQRVAHEGLVPLRGTLMREVAEANYRTDGTVEIDPLPLNARDYRAFTSRYEGDERGRFREVVLNAVSNDRFVEHRSWWLPGLYAECSGATSTGRVDWIDRRGGTELIGFDEWKAVDTMSEKIWVPLHMFDYPCLGIAENPVAWGAQNAADSASFDSNPLHYDLAPLITPTPYILAVANASSWGYNGMPAFHELSASGRDDSNLRFVIRLRRHSGQTRTSEGRSIIAETDRLNNYTASPDSGGYVAVAGSEAYFQRPESHRENSYGRSRGQSVELGSLFNPFWQVRLIAPTAGELSAARARQGGAPVR